MNSALTSYHLPGMYVHTSKKREENKKINFHKDLRHLTHEGENLEGLQLFLCVCSSFLIAQLVHFPAKDLLYADMHFK